MNRTKYLSAGLACALSVWVVGVSACESPREPIGSSSPSVDQGVGSKDAAKDVKLGEMSDSSDTETVEIPVTVTNHSSKPSDYYIEARIYNKKGEQVDTASTFVERVKPGHVAKDTLLGLNATTHAHHYDLTVVDRTAS